MLTVVTACYGYDSPQDPEPQDIDAEWICVSDRPRESGRWRVVVEERPHMSPRMAAHVVKCRPDRYADPDSGIIVWTDASARLTRGDALSTFIAPLLETQWMIYVATLPHPDRATIQAEWPEAAGQKRYTGQMLERQVRAYLAAGLPDEHLYATTVMVYRRCALARALGNMWLLEQLRWTCQDQLSLPYVAWKTGVDIATSEVDLWTTPLIALRPRHRDV